MAKTAAQESIDYETVARTVEAAIKQPVDEATSGNGVALPQSALAEEEVQTRGPVIVNTISGQIKDAQTGHTILEPAPVEPPPKESIIDISLIAMGLTVASSLIVVLGIAVSALALSQKLVLCGVVACLLGERIWWEVRRTGYAVEPEGVAYASQITEATGYPTGPDGQPAV